MPGGPPLVYSPAYLPQQPEPSPQATELKPEELEEFGKMFPAIDRTVIQVSRHIQP